jgi:hypothetical protein
MTDPITICNLALSWLGQNSINDFEDDQNEAKVMSANYALSRDLVLEIRPWTFATTRATLSKSSEVLDFGVGNKFLIPSTVLKVHRVFKPGGTRKFTPADWSREGKFIIAPEEIVWCVFINRVDNADLYLPSFVHALAARLAADTCITLTENRRLKEDMEKMYIMKIADASASDGAQGRNEVFRSGRLIGARSR